MNSVQTVEKAEKPGTARLGEISAIETELDQVTELLNEAANLNFPILNGLLKAIIDAGGKRLRPMMALLAARVPGKVEEVEPTKLFQVAAAVEMLHTATLVHD